MNRDEILANFADALELERELGVRAVELDRALLSVGGESPAAGVVQARLAGAASRRTHVDAVAHRVEKGEKESSSDAVRPPRLQKDPRPETRDAKAPLPLVFLHDRALSPKGVEMMAKIVMAMHQTPETAPVLFTGNRPSARVTVVLGLRALRQWFPGQAGSPGQWIAPDGQANVLVTYSPEYILRFGETPSVQKLKREMWTSLKSAMQRLP